MMVDYIWFNSLSVSNSTVQHLLLINLTYLSELLASVLRQTKGDKFHLLTQRTVESLKL